MEIIKKVGVGLCMAVAVSSVQAANWMKIADSGEPFYIDTTSIKTDGQGHVLAWVKTDYSAHPFAFGGDSRLVSTIVSRRSIDCRLDRIKVLSEEFYDAQGAFIGEADLPVQTYRDIPPDSPLEALEHASCR